MALPTHATRKHTWLGLLPCVVCFDLFHIKYPVFPYFILFVEVFLLNMPNILSLCVHVFMHVAAHVCGWSHLHRGPVVIVLLALSMGSGLFYTGSFTGLELKLTRLTSQGTLEIFLLLKHRNCKHLSPCLLSLCEFRESKSGPLACKANIFPTGSSFQSPNDALLNSATHWSVSIIDQST